jgi:serine/threonine protein kinase
MTVPTPARVTCPRCAVSAISPDTGTCDVCGYRMDAAVAVSGGDALLETVTRQLAHEFDIVNIVGRREGAFVLRALERNGGREVILKVVQRRADDADTEARFRTVLEAHQRVEHAHLVPILRFGTTDSLLWLTMPDTGAKPLRDRFRSAGRIEPSAACRLATQLVSALDALHRNGLVHGAVKAENVLVDPQDRAWLAEPAFARPLPPRRSTPAKGTKAVAPAAVPALRHPWMAPEDVMRIERSHTSDQFGLAAVLFEAVAGEAPLEPGEQIIRFRRDVPLGMSNALARALDPQPRRRFPSCADFLFALEQSVPGSTPEQRPPTRASTDVTVIRDWEPPEDAARTARIRVRVGTGLVVVLALVASVPSLLQKLQATREPPVAAASGAPVAVTPPSATPTAAPPAATRPAEPVAPRGESPAPPRTEPRPAPQPRRPVPPASIPSAAPSATPESPAAVAVARLTINASPWGQVFIDDVLIGNTPRANIEIAPGEHTIRVSRQGFTTFTRTVRLQAGETLRITDIVLTPVSP